MLRFPMYPLSNYASFNDLQFQHFDNFKLFKRLRNRFIHYSCVVIIFLNAYLYKSAFSTYSLKNKFYIFLCFFICSVLNSMSSSKTFYNICVIIVYKDICKENCGASKNKSSLRKFNTFDT